MLLNELFLNSCVTLGYRGQHALGYHAEWVWYQTNKLRDEEGIIWNVIIVAQYDQTKCIHFTVRHRALA